MKIKYIRASAGSGKTYQLSSQYLGILLRGLQADAPVDPGTILATTFTRAAAGEILERVLSRLARAVLDAGERENLRQNEKLSSLTKQDCSRALVMLAASLHRIGIGTIDSFFARVARSMPDELGLAGDWRIISENEARDLSARVFDRMLNAPEGRRLRELWEIWTKYRAGIRISERLLETMESARFLKLEENGAGPEYREPRRLEKEEADAACALIASLEIPTTNSGKPDSRIEKALDGLAAVFVPGTRLDYLTGSTLMVKMLAGDFSSNGKPLPEKLAAGLAPLLGEIKEIRRALFAGRCAAIREMQQRFAPGRDEAARSAGRLTFREIEEAVRRGIEPGDWDDETAAADIYFRLDGRINHLLFDEFQDTSWTQFEFFQPVIENLAAEAGRSVFVVGDAKQAIYGWRGGDREVIDSFPGRFPASAIEIASLSKSFRSSPAVLFAVDTVFKNLEDVKNFEEPFGAAAGAWLGEGGLKYQDHEAHKKDLRGRVRLWCQDGSQKNAETDKETQFVDAMVARVESLLATEAPEETAVLLRRNKYIPRIIDELRKRGIDASAGNSGSPVTDSFAVEVILAALTWLDHPGHSAARLLAAQAAWATGLDSDARWRIHAEWSRTWHHDGAGTLIGAWIRDQEFSRRLSTHDRLRCGQLLALARKFEESGGRPDDLVKMIRAERKAAGRSARVRVMTVHAAKGLEFEAVVLGDLANSGGGGFDRPRFIRNEGFDFLLPSSKEEAGVSGREALFDMGKRKEIMESLSLLYVGMTRAKCFLDIVVPPPGKSAKSYSPQALLNAVLNPNGAADFENPVWETIHEGNPPDGLKEKTAARPCDDPAFERLKPGAITGAPARFEPKSPSSQEGGGEIRIDSLFRTGSADAMAMGTAVHAWLAEIEWLPNAREADVIGKTLRATAKEWRGIPEELARQVLGELLANLISNGSELGGAFDRDRYAREWQTDKIEVWRERAFAVVKGGTVWQGRFDRVVIARNETNEIVAADIIDFKTDKEERPDFYQPQLDSYRTVLQQMLVRQETAPQIATRLIFTRGGTNNL
jgi:ATP-dependent exoDNAse (exonuclease V) beta subunit